MEKLPTAEELINNTGLCSCDLDTHGLMIKFAKIHVEAALNKVENTLTHYEGLTQGDIKDIYPLTNIK